MEDPDFNVVAMLILAVYSSTVTLPTCLHATTTIDNLSELSQIAYNSIWYKLPVEQQRMIILMICYAHRHRVISGFGIVNCSREGFMKVRFTFLNIN